MSKTIAMYQQQEQEQQRPKQIVNVETKDIDDVHNVLKAIEDLHQSYHRKLDEAATDCDEIYLYGHYVNDINQLLIEVIENFQDFSQKKLESSNQQKDDRNEVMKNKKIYQTEPVDLNCTCLSLSSSRNSKNDLNVESDNKSRKNFVRCEGANEKLGKMNSNSNSELFEYQNSGETSTTTKTIKKSTETVDSSESSSLSSNSKRLKGQRLRDRHLNIVFCSDDTAALVGELADTHDQNSKLLDRLRSLEVQLADEKKKVQFREKIIRNQRNNVKKSDQNSTSALLTPPRTPELKSNDSCSNSSDMEVYKSNYLTVPGGHQNHMSTSGDSCFSLYELDQESKNSSEVNLTLCFDDVNKDEVERLHHMIIEMESENGCNRLLITKLEDELLMMQKCETRTKHDRDLKADRLKVLKHKIKTIGKKLLEKSSNIDEELKQPQLSLNDLAMIEDDLKPEYDILTNIIKSNEAMKKVYEKTNDENRELVKTMEKLKLDLSDALKKNQILENELNRSSNKSKTQTTNNREEQICTATVNISKHLTRLLGKEIQAESISELSSSSSPESGESSLSPTNSLTEVINDWRRELEEKNCILREKNLQIQSLEDQLKHRDEEIADARETSQSIELDRDKNCQMVNQLKSAIQIHNDSIQFLKLKNAELRSELDETKDKFEKYHDCFNDVKKKNIELNDENQNLHKTINNLRSTIEDLKSGHSIQHSNDIDDLNANINLMNKQLYRENVQKDDQMNLLRDANLQLRSQVFDLNQDINDLLEIIENLKNRRLLEDYKVAQKEQEQRIEKEIIRKERDISHLKEFRSRCVEIESEYLEKMSSQKYKYDSTIKELESEITTLTEQLIQSHQQNTEHEELMKQTAVLQNAMLELEDQNDVMKRMIESYQQKFSELQVSIDKIEFDKEAMTIELNQLKSDVIDKSRKITELTVDQQRAQTELEMQKKSCKCSPNSSPQRRMTSTVVQMNDLKTKLMNMSLENSKASEALKRKSQQYEKLQRQATEEKSRLRDECLKSIQTIGELKSKLTMMEMKVQEQNDDVIVAKEKAAQAIARMTAIETELSSKNAKLEDLEEREQKWRNQAYEITQEIKSRKDEAFKREEKLIQELNTKNDSMKDQTRIILQNENSIRYLQSENHTLKNANHMMNQRMMELKIEVDELRKKEKEMTDSFEKAEEELKSIKSEFSQVFNSGQFGNLDFKSAASQYLNEKDDEKMKHESLMEELTSLKEENKTLRELKVDTIEAMELFKKVQSDSIKREKALEKEIARLQSDKRNLHKDRSSLTKQLLSKHRDMIILNSEIEKFRDFDDYESRSNSQSNSIQPFQSVMYPSAIAPLLRASSNPDIASDPISLDVKGMTEKLSRTRNFWAHGLKVAASSLIKVPPPDAIEQHFQNFATSQPSTSAFNEPFILNPPRNSQQFLSPQSQIFNNFPVQQHAESPKTATLNDSLDHDSISSEVTVVALQHPLTTQPEFSNDEIVLKDDPGEEQNSLS